jgi:sugar phosphate isomerase/epimerase
MFSTVGEDYTTPETIRQTGGVVPDQHWAENWEIAQNSARTARALGIRSVSMHAGFLPHDPADPSYGKLLDRVVRIAGVFAENDVTLLFETGQESAETLLAFLRELDRKGATNTGVNFDPANMILYNMEDPIAALRHLLPRVRQCHIKDAIRTKVPGQWGEEVVVGTGQVDWKAFLRLLAEGDFSGGLVFEREAGTERVGDIRAGKANLEKLLRSRGR